jgi:DMSO/TMAO reductase YedYZ molybdopterin-dependent catalytic subunit
VDGTPEYDEKRLAAKARLLEHFKRTRAEREAARERTRLPPGQKWTEGFPVLDLGVHPPFDPATWEFKVWGEVDNPVRLSWEQFRALPRAERVADFHCVTTWSRKDCRWGGVAMKDLLALVRPRPAALHLIQHCAEGYTTNTTLLEASAEDALLADSLDGAPLPLEHGGPVRMIIPTLYAWKSGKFLAGLEFSAADKPGFWETRGYHNEADPWKEQRHSG